MRSSVIVYSLLLPTLAGAIELEDISNSLELWAYGTYWQRNTDSLLNPDNVIAQLPTRQLAGEIRGQVQAETDNFDFKLRGVALGTITRGGQYAGDAAYLSQAFARVRFNANTTLSAGRLLLTWGPGQLRSPSNPFYFDAGKTQPLRELSGIDAASALYTGEDYSLQAARIFGNGYTNANQNDNFNGSQTGSQSFVGTTLLKLDGHGTNWQSSLIVSRYDADTTPYLGAYAQWTATDAILLYGEAGWGRRPQALQPDTYSLVTPSSRASTALLGGSYTLENGQTLYGEFLYDGHGYDAAAAETYFATARQANNQLATNPAAAGRLGRGLSTAPVLLNRHYAAIIWQSSPQDNELFWLGTWSINIEDRSQQLSFYMERYLNTKVVLFGSATKNIGGSDSEFGSLLEGMLQLGIKIFAM